MAALRRSGSGAQITQLTNYRGHSHHLYFTNPAGTRAEALLIGSDRGNRTIYGAWTWRTAR